MRTLTQRSVRFHPLMMAALAWTLAAPVDAEASDDAPRLTRLFTFDNDTFAHSDDNYTNGLQLGWLQGDLRDFRESRLPSFVTAGLARLPRINADLRQRFVGHSFSHRMFTPTDTSVSEPIPGDVPYSALLYGTLTAGAQDAQSLDAFSVSLGVVGPAAGGEWLQKSVHRLIGSAEPQGWDNQLRNEPLLNFAYEHRRRLHAFGERDRWSGDVIGKGAFSVGNLLTSATAGIAVRAGWSVPDDYWIPSQCFGDEAIGSQSLNPAASDFGFWGIVAVSGSLLGNAIFWDGNTFHDSLSVRHDAWLAHAYAGIRLRYRRIAASVGLSVVTVPWDNPANASHESFGSLSVAYAY